MASSPARAPAYTVFPPSARAGSERRTRRPSALRMRALSLSIRSMELCFGAGSRRCKAFSFRGQVVLVALVAIRFWRKSSRLLELSVTENITHRFSLCRPYLGIRHYTYILDWNPICCLLLSEESKILFNQELKQTKNQKSVCVWGKLLLKAKQ